MCAFVCALIWHVCSFILKHINKCKWQRSLHQSLVVFFYNCNVCKFLTCVKVFLMLMRVSLRNTNCKSRYTGKKSLIKLFFFVVQTLLVKIFNKKKLSLFISAKLDRCPMCRAPITSYFCIRSEDYVPPNMLEQQISKDKGSNSTVHWLDALNDRLTDFLGFR